MHYRPKTKPAILQLWRQLSVAGEAGYEVLSGGESHAVRKQQSVRIRYEVEGEGPPLVLHHGFGCFLETWYTGYVEGLKDDYQLVLMDARGCGGSDKPHDRES